ncbi:hypothetical protein [Sediminibacter sp. Hel_I_10]|nr:hypothetical protein [Sediminibacter sp. Hel_I_10]
MGTKGEFWSHRKPADMHDDGVHFNKEQLAKKKAKELQKKESNKNNSEEE